MARIFTEGFEGGTGTTFDEYGTSQGMQTGIKRSGDCSLLVSYPNGWVRVYTGDITEVFVRFGVYFTGGTDQFQIFDDDDNEIATLQFTAFAPIEARIDDVPVGTGQKWLAPNLWHLIEVRYKFDTGSPNGIFHVKVEGVDDIVLTGETTNPFSADYLGKVGWVTGVSLDDIAVNDTTGGADNSWPGDGRIVPVRPNGNGDSSNFAGSDGNSTNNYQLVDDILTDSDTTYVESATSGHIDLYQAQDITLFAEDAIKRVWVSAIVKELTSDGDTIQLGLKPNGASSPFWTTSAPVTENYRQYNSAAHTVNPHTGVAWTDADIDGLQIGIKVP